MRVRAAVHGVVFDAVMGWVDRCGFADVRRHVCEPAIGDVLEIGAGSGANLAHLRGAASITVIEPDGALMARLRRRAGRSGWPVVVTEGSGEAIPFGDATFDTVVATLVLCSVQDPDAVVGELRRVLKPGGALRFAEHVRAPEPSLARRQDQLAPMWCRCTGGCRPNRDTLATIERGGFDVTSLTRTRMHGVPKIVRPLIIGVARPQPRMRNI